jgi:hypothetical protein
VAGLPQSVAAMCCSRKVCGLAAALERFASTTAEPPLRQLERMLAVISDGTHPQRRAATQDGFAPRLERLGRGRRLERLTRDVQKLN